MSESFSSYVTIAIIASDLEKFEIGCEKKDG